MIGNDTINKLAEKIDSLENDIKGDNGLIYLIQKTAVIETKLEDLQIFFDTKFGFFMEYFKKVEALYKLQTDEIVDLKKKCADRLGNCIEKIGENKVFSLEGKNRTLFQILTNLLTFICGLSSGLIIVMFSKHIGK